MLYNGGNDYLHYEDTWYILASKPDEYVVVYYIGNNDAWRGYGGGTVYTRYVRLQLYLICVFPLSSAVLPHGYRHLHTMPGR